LSEIVCEGKVRHARYFKVTPKGSVKLVKPAEKTIEHAAVQVNPPVGHPGVRVVLWFAGVF
jgi:hypothetical protein